MTKMRAGRGASIAFAAIAAIGSCTAALGDEGLERAIALAAESRDAEARELLDGVLAREPNLPRARLLDGVLRARAGRESEAIEIFVAIRRDHPDLSEPYNNLAVLYAAKGRFGEAREILLEALKRKPSAVTYANLGDIYTNLARLAYQRAGEVERGEGPAGESALVLEDAEEVARPPAVPAAPAAPAVASPAPAPPPRATVNRNIAWCVRAGGFQDPMVLIDAEKWLRSRGVRDVLGRSERIGKVASYRVYLPPLASRAAAAAKVREIRSRGVDDVALIPDGELQNGISFGIYAVEKNMLRRMADLQELGYPVRRKDNLEEGGYEYVIKARMRGDFAALSTAWKKRFPEHAIEFDECGGASQ